METVNIKDCKLLHMLSNGKSRYQDRSMKLGLYFYSLFQGI